MCHYPDKSFHNKSQFQIYQSLSWQLVNLKEKHFIINTNAQHWLCTQIFLTSLLKLDLPYLTQSKMFPDYSAFSLIRAGWHEEGHPAIKNSLQYPWLMAILPLVVELTLVKCPVISFHASAAEVSAYNNISVKALGSRYMYSLTNLNVC